MMAINFQVHGIKKIIKCEILNKNLMWADQLAGQSKL
jgi:hypothetical protein